MVDLVAAQASVGKPALRRTRILVASVLAAIGLGGAAVAQDRPDRVVQVTPYVWAAGVGGTVRPFEGAPSLEIDSSFADLLEDLDGAFFLSGYVRADRFVLIGDFSYASASRSGRVALPGFGSVPAEGRLRQTSLTLAGGYRVADGPAGTLDLLAGARAWRVRASLDVADGAVSRSPDLDFVDPIVAARANIRLAPRWSAILYADLGGFGVGSDSTAQAVGTVNYQLGERTFLSGGYRHLGLDYRDGGTRVDMRMSGPILGATFRF